MLIVAGAVLVGSLDGWKGVPLALALSYLGLGLLLLATLGVIPALVEIVVATGVVGVLATSSTVASPTIALDPRIWLPAAFRPSWFELSVTALAVVGALALASARAILGTGVDQAVDVLVFTGLLNCLVGRSPRIACGLLFLVSAGSVAIQEVSRHPIRTEWLMLAVLPILLSLAIAHLRSAEEQRPPDRSGPATAEGDGAT